MPRFKVGIPVETEATYEVEADDQAQAIDKAWDRFESGDFGHLDSTVEPTHMAEKVEKL